MLRSKVERFALPIALCLIAIGAVRVASTYRSISITLDEPYHFSCGLDYLATGRACAPENPPLQPVASALLPYLDGVRPDPVSHERARDRFEIGGGLIDSIARNHPDPWRVIVRMRAGVLPFFVIAGLAVFFGARHFYGNSAAILSVALFTMIPTVLAHAGLATTDISLTAMLPAAFFTLAWWSESPSWKRAVALGIATGLAIFAKFSTLGYLPVAAALAVASHIVVTRPSRAGLLHLARERVGGLLLAIAVAAFVLWAGCLFSFGPVPGWPGWVRVPAPELFGAFRELMDHARRGHGAYFLGKIGDQGWWMYYPVALAVKTPIALMVAAAVGLFACWQERKRSGLLPIAFCLGILVVAMPSRINLGTRHILPMFAGMSIIAALGLLWLARIWVVLPAALLAWMAVSGAHAHPDYLAYFNEFAGERPEDILLDSDLDWDQDWVLAARILREAGAKSVTLDLGHTGYTTDVMLERVYGLPPLRPPNVSGVPDPGWHVISAMALRLSPTQGRFEQPAVMLQGPLAHLSGLWYGRLRPSARAGGLFLFHVPPDFR